MDTKVRIFSDTGSRLSSILHKLNQIEPSVHPVIDDGVDTAVEHSQPVERQVDVAEI